MNRKRILLAGTVLCALCVLCAGLMIACDKGGDGKETSAPTDAPTEAVTDDPSSGTTDPATEPATDPAPETDAPTEAPTEPPTEPTDDPIETAAEQQTEPVTEPETEEQYIVDNHHPASEAGAVSDKILKAADFGAKGDGVTDDAAAVSAAVRAAAEQHATLQFEAGKTYLLSAGTNTAGPFHGPLAADDASGFTIDGQGCTFLMEPGVSFFAWTVRKNCLETSFANVTGCNVAASAKPGLIDWNGVVSR